MNKIIGMGLLEGAKDLMTPTRTKELQNFYGIKYKELWDEKRLKKLGVTTEHIKEIKEIRGKELAYKDTVGYELGEGVIDSVRFKEIKSFYGITLEDTQEESLLKEKGLGEDDIDFILGRVRKARKETKAQKTAVQKKKTAVQKVVKNEDKEAKKLLDDANAQKVKDDKAESNLENQSGKEKVESTEENPFDDTK